MAATFQALSLEETPRGTSALNVIQRSASAIGTALLAIVLQRAIAANLPDLEGGVHGVGLLVRQPETTPLVAEAFGRTFWVAVGLIAASLVPALLLPRRQPNQHAQPAADPPGQDQTAAA